jgi:hypothetical protein
MNTTTTEMERAALVAIATDQYNDGSLAPSGADVAVWTWSVSDTFACDYPRRSFPGVVASLNKKGLTGSDEAGEDSTIWLTEAGAEQIASA